LQAIQLVELLGQLGVFDICQGGQALLHGLAFVAGQAFLVGHAGYFSQHIYFVGELEPVGFKLFHLLANGGQLPFGIIGTGLLHKVLQPVFGPRQVLAVLVQNLVQKTQLPSGSFRLLGQLFGQIHRVYLVNNVLRFARVEVVE